MCSVIRVYNYNYIYICISTDLCQSLSVSDFLYSPTTSNAAKLQPAIIAIPCNPPSQSLQFTYIA